MLESIRKIQLNNTRIIEDSEQLTSDEQRALISSLQSETFEIVANAKHEHFYCMYSSNKKSPHILLTPDALFSWYFQDYAAYTAEEIAAHHLQLPQAYIDYFNEAVTEIDTDGARAITDLNFEALITLWSERRKQNHLRSEAPHEDADIVDAATHLSPMGLPTSKIKAPSFHAAAASTLDNYIVVDLSITKIEAYANSKNWDVSTEKLGILNKPYKEIQVKGSSELVHLYEKQIILPGPLSSQKAKMGMQMIQMSDVKAVKIRNDNNDIDALCEAVHAALKLNLLPIIESTVGAPIKVTLQDIINRLNGTTAYPAENAVETKLSNILDAVEPREKQAYLAATHFTPAVTSHAMPGSP